MRNSQRHIPKHSLGRGGGGGASFLGGSNSSLKKIKTSTIWKNFCDKRLLQKIVMGGKPNNAPPHAEKEIPPTHGKNGMAPAYVERKDCPHKNTPIWETPPPQMDFFIHVSPTWRASISPLACADHDL